MAVDLLVGDRPPVAQPGPPRPDGHFRIDGVTGPDEYSAIADNNVYTNLMAEQNMRAAAAMAARHPERAEELAVTTEEMASWRDAADAMVVPYDEKLGVHPQSEGFTTHAVWDFANTPADKYPLLMHYPYFDLYRKQVVKQADLVLALHRRGDVVHLRREGPGLPLLRGADGAGLVAVRLHAGGGGRRAGLPGAGPRLPGRGRAHGPGGPGPQHPRRPAHGVAGGGVDRARRGAGRHAGPATAGSSSRRGCRRA